MNIFILHENPKIAARNLCDQHINKMLIESVQLLSTAANLNGLNQNVKVYKTTHQNHPCSIWTRTSNENFKWLIIHANEIYNQYVFRYKKSSHKSKLVLDELLKHFDYQKLLPNIGLTPFAKCVDISFKCFDTVTAYRKFYKFKGFPSWNKGVAVPNWWNKI